MHRNCTARRLMPWALVLTLGLVALTTSRAQPPDTKDLPPVGVDRTGTLIVPLGGVVAFDAKLPGIPTKILISREDVLGVKLDPNNPKLLLLNGKAPGLSQLTIVQKDRPDLKYEVLVQPDLTQLRNLIKRTVPTASVDVQPGIGNVVILSGYVTSPQDAEIVARLANSAVGGSAANVINAIQVGGVQQVEIDVVIASVDRNQLRSRGFDFSAPGRGSFSFNSLVSGLLGAQTGGLAGPSFTGDGNLQVAVVPNRFFGALRALRTEGVAKFLAEPRVVTQTGRPAFFRAGGQQAIISGTSGITGPGVTLQPFGTELEVVPIVYGNGMIWLDINPRITAVSQGLGLVVNGTATPGFTEQSVRSTVLLESGQTFAIGGLIQNSVQASSSKIPFLGDLPFSGTLFSRVDYTTRESELVILVTPRLVHPMDPCQAPKRLPGQETRTPDDYELFLENVLEVPRGQRKVWNGKCYSAPYKSDPTLGKYPCVGGACPTPNGTSLPGNAAGALINPRTDSYTGRATPAPRTPVTPPVLSVVRPSVPSVVTQPVPSVVTPPVLSVVLPNVGASAPMLAPEMPTAIPPISGVPATATSEPVPVTLPPLPPVEGAPLPPE